jgi:putative hydrolase of the HAD superfamily
MDKFSPKHIFFDLDHTLWDFEKNSAATFELLFDKFNISLDLTQFLEVYIPANMEYWKLYRQGKIAKEELRYRRLSDVFNRCNYSVSDRMIGEMTDGYIEYLSSFTHVFDYTKELLDYLVDRYPLHILTNGFAEIQSKKLKGAGLEGYFQTVVNAEDVGFKKPHPKIFAFALDKAKATASESLMIGDDLEADILGAKNCGLDALHFDVEKVHSHSHCVIVNCLSEIKQYL